MRNRNQWMKKQIKEAQKKGIPVLIDGKKYPSGNEKYTLMIRDEVDYMSDYISDESGKIIELNFNRLNRKK